MPDRSFILEWGSSAAGHQSETSFANVASVSRPKVFFLRAFGSMHGGLETAATP